MTGPSSKRRVVRYFCTAGNGMEMFVVEELKKKLEAEDVCHLPGKVIFSSSAGIDTIRKLKAAERLFLLLKQDSPLKLFPHTSPAKAAYLLQSKLLADMNEWTHTVMMWKCLQGELIDRETPECTPGTVVGVKRKREEASKGKEDREEKEKCDGVFIKTKEQRDEESRNGRVSDGQNGAETSKKKTKTSEEEKEDERVEMDEENTNSVRTTAGPDKTLLQPSRDKPEMPFPVSFRISCKCSGGLARYFSTQQVSQVMGSSLSRMLGWKVDLRNPQLEVNIYLSDDQCLLGIPLTRLPLANRNYIKTTGLRSTVAWAMASVAQIQPGFCVVDPMCGVGTILIEAAKEHEDACFLGMDIDEGQLQKANENVAFAELENRIQLLKASSMALPLQSASVDAVVCDLPFGRKFGTKTDMAANLPLILMEMERVLCVGGTLVLLLSPQLSSLLKKLQARDSIEPNSFQEMKPQTETQDCPSVVVSSTKQQTCKGHNIELSSTQGAEPQTGTHHSSRHFSSLRHDTTLRVSLGTIDGLIHKYVKTGNSFIK
ncbi:THUMP domain-containing protein 2 isoform X1 [Sphaeramia orbicularis]|uniref:THUMP domain-containing protein n=1 Tax=Sphaeramia orbicularis TaxID=375764 RepID=A0A673CI97_9TELE|nr:THUMP domain-containing protein 2 isoform X1 [Sphaeramia orbicularis]